MADSPKIPLPIFEAEDGMTVVPFQWSPTEPVVLWVTNESVMGRHEVECLRDSLTKWLERGR